MCKRNYADLLRRNQAVCDFFFQEFTLHELYNLCGMSTEIGYMGLFVEWTTLTPRNGFSVMLSELISCLYTEMTSEKIYILVQKVEIGRVRL